MSLNTRPRFTATLRETLQVAQIEIQPLQADERPTELFNALVPHLDSHNLYAGFNAVLRESRKHVHAVREMSKKSQEVDYQVAQNAADTTKIAAHIPGVLCFQAKALAQKHDYGPACQLNRLALRMFDRILDDPAHANITSHIWLDVARHQMLPLWGLHPARSERLALRILQTIPGNPMAEEIYYTGVGSTGKLIPTAQFSLH